MDCTSVIVGTVLKYRVTATCEGFSMQEDDFYVELQLAASGRKLRIEKDEMFIDIDENYYFFFDTADPGPGDYYVTTVMFVKDTDADGEVRKVVDRQFLVTVEP